MPYCANTYSFWNNLILLPSTCVDMGRCQDQKLLLQDIPEIVETELDAFVWNLGGRYAPKMLLIRN